LSFIDSLGEQLPTYAADVRRNIETSLYGSGLVRNDALAVALASAFASRSRYLVETLRRTEAIAASDAELALAAASLMSLSNTWYPFLSMAHDAAMRALPSRLRMGGETERTDAQKRTFEMCALAASIIGKCDFCVTSHLELLKGEGLSVSQLADIGRIAASIAAAAQVLAVEGVQ
jgi:alkyl hydroperoxide reductase subunit D